MNGSSSRIHAQGGPRELQRRMRTRSSSALDPLQERGGELGEPSHVDSINSGSAVPPHARLQPIPHNVLNGGVSPSQQQQHEREQLRSPPRCPLPLVVSSDAAAKRAMSPPLGASRTIVSRPITPALGGNTSLSNGGGLGSISGSGMYSPPPNGDGGPLHLPAAGVRSLLGSRAGACLGSPAGIGGRLGSQNGVRVGTPSGRIGEQYQAVHSPQTPSLLPQIRHAPMSRDGAASSTAHGRLQDNSIPMAGRICSSGQQAPPIWDREDPTDEHVAESPTKKKKSESKTKKEHSNGGLPSISGDFKRRKREKERVSAVDEDVPPALPEKTALDTSPATAPPNEAREEMIPSREDLLHSSSRKEQTTATKEAGSGLEGVDASEQHNVDARHHGLAGFQRISAACTPLGVPLPVASEEEEDRKEAKRKHNSNVAKALQSVSEGANRNAENKATDVGGPSNITSSSPFLDIATPTTSASANGEESSGANSAAMASASAPSASVAPPPNNREEKSTASHSHSPPRLPLPLLDLSFSKSGRSPAASLIVAANPALHAAPPLGGLGITAGAVGTKATADGRTPPSVSAGAIPSSVSETASRANGRSPTTQPLLQTNSENVGKASPSSTVLFHSTKSLSLSPSSFRDRMMGSDARRAHDASMSIGRGDPNEASGFGFGDKGLGAVGRTTSTFCGGGGGYEQQQQVLQSSIRAAAAAVAATASGIGYYGRTNASPPSLLSSPRSRSGVGFGGAAAKSPIIAGGGGGGAPATALASPRSRSGHGTHRPTIVVVDSTFEGGRRVDGAPSSSPTCSIGRASSFRSAPRSPLNMSPPTVVGNIGTLSSATSSCASGAVSRTRSLAETEGASRATGREEKKDGKKNEAHRSRSESVASSGSKRSDGGKAKLKSVSLPAEIILATSDPSEAPRSPASPLSPRDMLRDALSSSVRASDYLNRMRLEAAAAEAEKERARAWAGEEEKGAEAHKEVRDANSEQQISQPAGGRLSPRRREVRVEAADESDGFGIAFRRRDTIPSTDTAAPTTVSSKVSLDNGSDNNNANASLPSAADRRRSSSFLTSPPPTQRERMEAVAARLSRQAKDLTTAFSGTSLKAAMAEARRRLEEQRQQLHVHQKNPNHGGGSETKKRTFKVTINSSSSPSPRTFDGPTPAHRRSHTSLGDANRNPANSRQTANARAATPDPTRAAVDTQQKHSDSVVGGGEVGVVMSGDFADTAGASPPPPIPSLFDDSADSVALNLSRKGAHTASLNGSRLAADGGSEFCFASDGKGAAAPPSGQRNISSSPQKQQRQSNSFTKRPSSNAPPSPLFASSNGGGSRSASRQQSLPISRRSEGAGGTPSAAIGMGLGASVLRSSNNWDVQQYLFGEERRLTTGEGRAPTSRCSHTAVRTASSGGVGGRPSDPHATGAKFIRQQTPLATPLPVPAMMGAFLRSASPRSTVVSGAVAAIGSRGGVGLSGGGGGGGGGADHPLFGLCSRGSAAALGDGMLAGSSRASGGHSPNTSSRQGRNRVGGRVGYASHTEDDTSDVEEASATNRTTGQQKAMRGVQNIAPSSQRRLLLSPLAADQARTMPFLMRRKKGWERNDTAGHHQSSRPHLATAPAVGRHQTVPRRRVSIPPFHLSTAVLPSDLSSGRRTLYGYDSKVDPHLQHYYSAKALAMAEACGSKGTRNNNKEWRRKSISPTSSRSDSASSEGGSQNSPTNQQRRRQRKYHQRNTNVSTSEDEDEFQGEEDTDAEEREAKPTRSERSAVDLALSALNTAPIRRVEAASMRNLLYAHGRVAAPKALTDLLQCVDLSWLTEKIAAKFGIAGGIATERGGGQKASGENKKKSSSPHNKAKATFSQQNEKEAVSVTEKSATVAGKNLLTLDTQLLARDDTPYGTAGTVAFTKTLLNSPRSCLVLVRSGQRAYGLLERPAAFYAKSRSEAISDEALRARKRRADAVRMAVLAELRRQYVELCGGGEGIGTNNGRSPSSSNHSSRDAAVFPSVEAAVAAILEDEGSLRQPKKEKGGEAQKTHYPNNIAVDVSGVDADDDASGEEEEQDFLYHDSPNYDDAPKELENKKATTEEERQMDAVRLAAARKRRIYDRVVALREAANAKALRTHSEALARDQTRRAVLAERAASQSRIGEAKRARAEAIAAEAHRSRVAAFEGMEAKGAAMAEKMASHQKQLADARGERREAEKERLQRAREAMAAIEAQREEKFAASVERGQRQLERRQQREAEMRRRMADKGTVKDAKRSAARLFASLKAAKDAEKTERKLSEAAERLEAAQKRLADERSERRRAAGERQRRVEATAERGAEELNARAEALRAKEAAERAAFAESAAAAEQRRLESRERRQFLKGRRAAQTDERRRQELFGRLVEATATSDKFAIFERAKAAKVEQTERVRALRGAVRMANEAAELAEAERLRRRERSQDLGAYLLWHPRFDPSAPEASL